MCTSNVAQIENTKVVDIKYYLFICSKNLPCHKKSSEIILYGLNHELLFSPLFSEFCFTGENTFWIEDLKLEKKIEFGDYSFMHYLMCKPMSRETSPPYICWLLCWQHLFRVHWVFDLCVTLMDYKWTPRESFSFKNSKLLGLGRQLGQTFWGYFGYLPILALRVPCP